MTPLERAARALASLESFGDEELWQDWIPEARAVLMAVCEPSEAMLEAGFGESPSSILDCHVRESLPHVWQSMIYAALEE